MSGHPFTGRALPFPEWPERDRRAWLEAQKGDEDDNSLLSDDRPAAGWRASSKELFVRCYGIWLNWLNTQDLLDPLEAPETRVTRPRLAAYMQAERSLGNGAKTLVNHAVSLRHMFEALAPSLDWTWMLPFIRKLKTAATTTKNHSDLPSIRELFELGMALMHYVDAGKAGTVKQCAVMYRNGLFIAMLAARPYMRRNNIATIKIGKQIVREGSVYRLRFSSDDMKGRISRGGPLPEMLTSYIERYIRVHRPVLFLSKPDADGTLFISALGNPIFPHSISSEIGKLTYAFFGRRICTHEFRHATGSSIAKEDPEHVGIAPTVLGHTDFSTSESYYIFAKEHAAFLRLEQALEKLAKSDEGSPIA
jgi:site-specific recombinase XerD